ncbi:MAG: hypothetical protein R3336_03380, partial [Phycisphaeraceae bacterium]|nr:hypothetical protein [Phycisphaeraceae bacterium]
TLRCGAVTNDWFPEFDERRANVKQIAEDFEAIWVDFQALFDENVDDEVDPDYWAADGVHPSVAGHALMAQYWLDKVDPD